MPRSVPPPKPRDRRLDSAAKPPLVAPPRRRQESSDDLTALQADDAREAQLRAAAAELERERAATRAAAVARAQAEAERDRNAAEVGRLSVVAAPPAPRAPKSEAPPDSKGTVRAQGNGWKIAVPVGALAVLAAPVTALIQHFVALDRSNAELIKAVAGYEKRSEERDKLDAARDQRVTDLTVVVARMSGFLEKSFAKVGLDVKAESGAQAVELKTDPQSASAAAATKRQAVRVQTLIPAPAPVKGR